MSIYRHSTLLTSFLLLFLTLNGRPGLSAEYTEADLGPAPQPPTETLLPLPPALAAARQISSTPSVNYTIGSPTKQEMYFIHQLNRARSDPAAWAEEMDLSVSLSSVASQPPLAPNPYLMDSAGTKAEEMADDDYFNHVSQTTGIYPNELADDSGYTLNSIFSLEANNIESIAAGYSSALDALIALIEDDYSSSKADRALLLSTTTGYQKYREIGVGYGYDSASTYTYYWAAHTAYTNSTDTFLTGVVYKDADGDGEFDAGEGLSGVTIMPDQGTYYATSCSTGGYSLPLTTSGTLNLILSGGELTGRIKKSVATNTSGTNILLNFEAGDATAYPTISLTAADNYASEKGPDSGSFLIIRTGDTSEILNLSYTATGTAVNGYDYQALNGQVTLAAGATSAVITITPISDIEVENPETVILTLNSGSNFGLDSSATSASLTIYDSTHRTDIENFVTRFYQYALNRTPDSAGLNSWATALETGAKAGVDLAEGLIDSDEFKNRNLSNSDFLETLYLSCFNRASDAAGKSAWLSQLEGGVLRKDVLYGFAFAAEYQNLCNSYAIATTSAAAIRTKQVRDFVRRFYQQCLSREPDETGITNWVNNLLSGANKGADVARGFVLSNEFINRNLDNSAFLDVLYAAFFNRTADSAGKQSWLTQLNAGTSRSTVLNGFIYAAEFSNLCASYGITAY